MTHKKGRALKNAIEWVLDSKGKELTIGSGVLPSVYGLAEWHSKKFEIGILMSLKQLASYSPRRLEELDAQRQIETEG